MAEKSIVLIGGGVISACTAYFARLKYPDAKITIVEANKLAHNASGNAGGFLSKSMCQNTPFLKKLSKASFDLHLELNSKLQGETNYGFRKVNVYAGAHESKNKHVNSPDSWLTSLSTFGDFERIGDESNSAQLTPLEFTRTLVNASRVTLLERTTPVSIVYQHGNHVNGIQLRNLDSKEMSLIDCSVIFFCCGAWTPTVLKYLGLDPPQSCSPHKAHSIVLDDSEHKFTNDMLFGDSHGWNIEIYPRPDGTIYACGSTGEEDTDLPSPENITISSTSIGCLLSSFKKSVGYSVEGYQTKSACFLPFSPKGSSEPFIGYVGKNKSIVASYGHGCWGILNSTATGYLLSELLHGKEEEDLKKLL